MKYNKAKQTIAFMAAALLACQPVSAYAATFADINQAPWPGAETAINKAADLGLVVGETSNGKTYFRPRDSVSLAESCQLAYKLLQQSGKASASSSVTEKWATVLTTYGIQEWAHPAVSFCLEEGIISISNLSSFMKNGSNLPATREQAVTILGRALTTGVSSYSANATTTKFNDNSSISSEARPYVALLNEVGVVNGDDTGNFNPKKTLNRTETAVLVTNLYNVLQKETTSATSTTSTNSSSTTSTSSVSSTQSGTIKDMNNLYVNFENSNAYYLFASNGVTITLNGASSSVSNLVTLFKDGNTIKATLTLDSSSRITKLAATCETKTTSEKATKGTLTKVTYDDDDNDGSIVIEKTSTYKIDDGDDVDITIDKKSYDLEGLYDLFKDCEDDDQTIEVTLTLNSKGEVTKITGSIEDDDDDGDTVKGEVSTVSYDEDEEEGYIKLKNKSTKYYIKDTDDVTVKIDSKTKDYEDLYDLYEDDEYLYVKLTLDSKDYVTKIEASTDEDDDDDEDEVDGTISKVTYDDDDEEGTIKIGSKTYEASDTDDVDIEITDGKTKIKDWEELYDAYRDGKTLSVTLTLDDDEITEISGKVTKAKGILTSWDDDYLKLKGTKSGTSFKYEFDEDDADDIDVDIDGSGMSKIDTMEDFIEWLEDNFDDDDDEFTLVLKLDKNGYITEVTGEYE